jgi:hypothetical protein
VAAGEEGGGRDRGEVGAGPGRGFGAFDDDCVAGEDGGYDWGDEVVELSMDLVFTAWGWIARGAYRVTVQ